MSGEISSIDSPYSTEKIGLYFHIPFCRKKCDYCHFYVLPDKEPFKIQFMKALELDWRQWEKELAEKEIATIYFGGGTPSLLGPGPIEKILSWIGKGSNATEITLEANPEDITTPRMKAFKEAGINRVSIGIQSFDDALLQHLSRTHNAKRGKDAIWEVKEAGIDNISIDLMYDLPYQSLEQWKATLAEVEKLPVTHLSLYNLVFEPQTVFYKKREFLKKHLPEERISAKMYQEAVASLQKAGFLQYEISAFQKPGFYSRHNTGYWLGRPFVGLGPSAFSYWNFCRFRNQAHLSGYLKSLEENRSPVDFHEELLGKDRVNELLAIHLRLIEGVDLNVFQKRQGVISASTFSSLVRLNEEGLLQLQENRVRLTEKGILFYDTVASEIV